MGYFDDSKNVDQYISMAEGYDGAELIKQMSPHLKPGSEVLELGMGPGKDLILLEKAGFVPTGSDYAFGFIDYVRSHQPNRAVLQLSAVTIETDQTFDAIYSNKVLHQFSLTNIATSIQNQALRLKTGGLIFHSFWAGSGSETFNGDTYYYFEPADIEPLMSENFTLIESKHYTEMDENDSFWLAALKNS